MTPVPNTIFSQYEFILKEQHIPIAQYADYKKWLRYYLDYCAKYPAQISNSERVRLFLAKLCEKKQTGKRCQQAAHAISLYFEILRLEIPKDNSLEKKDQQCYVTPPVQQVQPMYIQQKSQYNEAGYQEKSSSPEWDEVMSRMAGEIKVRHYSRKTLKTYSNWSRQFQRFLKNKPPQELTTADVKEYLTYLAVKCKVAASTQNQAFNSLLFFFRHGLKREFGVLQGVPRAKKSLYIPTVLSRPKIDAILDQLRRTHKLVVQLLFGCGLRLFECLQLRVGDFNFDTGKLLVHGKGKKDRTVPLPELITAELKAQIARVGKLHDRDLAEGYDGVFLDDAIEAKYPKAPKEFIYQWFFPQKDLTLVAETG